MKTVTGDLLALALQGEFEVIVHGCNCQGQMGKGIALAIRKQFPEAYQADREAPKGERSKLGTISWAEVKRDGCCFTIVNAYTQFHWRGKGIQVEYEAVRGAMREIKRRFHGKRIGYPTIGAGLAGGDWAMLAAIIDEELAGEDHTCVVYGL